MKPVHIVFLIAINVLWGFNFVASKMAVEGLPPLLVTGLRFLIVFVLLVPFLKIIPGQMRRVLAIAFLLGVINFAAIFIGLAKAGDVSSVAIVAQLGVPFSTLMAIVFLGERIGLWRTGGIVLAFAGAMVLGFDPKVLQYGEAMLWILLSAVVYGVVAVQMRLVEGVPPMTLTAWMGLISFPCHFLLSAVFESGQIPALTAASAESIFGVVYAAIVATIIGHAGFYFLLNRYSVTAVMPSTLLGPVFAVISAIFVFDEVLTMRMLAGGLITFAGIAIITFRNAKPAAEGVPRVRPTA